MDNFISGQVSRRSLFKAGAVVAGAAATGGTLFSSISPAAAALAPTLPRSGTRVEWYKNKDSAIPEARMQSFAFDSANRKMFTATRVDGTSGDLEIRRVQVGTPNQGNNSSDRMIVAGAGHGVAFGIEPIGGDSYVWIEYAQDSSHYGTQLARFRFVPGRNTSTSVESGVAFGGDRFLFPGNNSVCCSVDHVYNYGDGLARLAVYIRASASDPLRLEVYKLHGLSAPPELEWAQRINKYDVDGVNQGGKLQGFAFYANRYYAITGSHGADDTYLHLQTPVEPKIPDWTPNVKMESSNPTKQGIPSGISDAEPEGIAVYRPDTAGSETVRLNYGFASNGTPRKNSVYYREALGV